jgi:hypothetical protein
MPPPSDTCQTQGTRRPGPDREVAMSDLDDFVAETHPRLIAELQALHNGDPNPQLET